MIEKTKGSQWIKCDLHVHTPASCLHKYGDKNQLHTWDKFIEDLENLSSEFKMIGINDYLTIEGYKRILEAKKNGRLPNIECILPVVEFRINRFVGEKKLKRINYHIIFSNEINPNAIETQFLNALSADYTLESGSKDPTWSAILSDDSLVELGEKIKNQTSENICLQNKSSWEVGFNNFNVDYNALKKILQTPVFAGKILRAIGMSEWSDFRWDGGGAADKRTIINEADIVFSACESVEHYQRAKNNLNKQNVKELLLDCSDAHTFSSSTDKDRIGNCYTWLKIEPSFNGLKQIIVEPQDRVKISETYPDTKPSYQVIDSIQFVNGGNYFSNEEIFLSSGLNSIIGGKSTGKSLLASLIVKSSDPAEYLKRKGKENENELNWIKEKVPNVDFEVHWKDGVTSTFNAPTSERKVTYFPQHYLHSKINDNGKNNKELNEIIYNILSQTESYANAFENYSNRIQEQDCSIASDCNNFERKLVELSGLKDLAQKKGKSSDIEKNIEKLNDNLSEIKNRYNLTEEEIESHRKFLTQTENLIALKETLTRDIDALSLLNKEEITTRLQPDTLFNNIWGKLNLSISEKIRENSQLLTSSFIDRVEEISSKFLEEQKDSLRNIKNELTNIQEIHLPILKKVKKSVALTEQEDLLKKEKIKLKEVKVLENNIENIVGEIGCISTNLLNYISKKLELTKIITTAIAEYPFSKEEEKLGLSIDPYCKADHIKRILKEKIMYKSNKIIKEYIENENFKDTDIEIYKETINKIIEQSKKSSLDLKKECRISDILEELLTNVLYLNYDLRFDGDSFNIMSPGKKALVFLNLLIDLDLDQNPIIIDQPEDDLDNRSIYEGLVNYIRNKKRNRQIIVVTHNPNVAVCADSEHVIVANQSGQGSNKDNRNFHFEYIYGGLENSFKEDPLNQYVLEKKGIREHVCEILDGGKEAFQRREKVYFGAK